MCMHIIFVPRLERIVYTVLFHIALFLVHKTFTAHFFISFDGGGLIPYQPHQLNSGLLMSHWVDKFSSSIIVQMFELYTHHVV